MGWEGELDWYDWVQGLCSHFFDEQVGSRRVFLFADDDALSEIADSESGPAVESLIAAVHSRTGSIHAPDPFRDIRAEARRWRSEGPVGCPPYLPLLALMVNAATRQMKESDLASHNYYRRFRDLMGWPGTGAPSGFRKASEALWRDLDRWLEEDMGGRRGRSTVRTGHFRYVGYPQSQALFRRSDEERLQRLFSQLGIPPRSKWDESNPPVTPSEMVLQFRVWSPTAPGLSPGARHLAEDEHRDVLEAVLDDALTRWDGNIERDGRRVVQLALALDMWERKLHLFARRHDGLGEDLEVDGFGTLSSNGGSWYSSAPLPMDAARLKTGWQHAGWQGERPLLLEFEASSVLPFREDLELGMWVGQTRVVPHAEHWVMAQHGVSGTVRTFLTKHAEPGWSEVPEIAGAPDYTFFRSVEINARPTNRDPELWRLVPQRDLKVSIVGGLRLRDYPTPTFLLGGAPDIDIPPNLLTGASGEVRVDGQAVRSPGVDGGELVLRDLHLSEGHHTVTVGDRDTSLYLLRTAGRSSHANAGTVGMSIRPGPPPLPVAPRPHKFDQIFEGVRVSGGTVRGCEPFPRPRPVVLRVKASKSFLLGVSPLEVEAVVEPDHPEWVDRVGLDTPRFEATGSFPVVWVLQRYGALPWEVTCVDPQASPDIPSAGFGKLSPMSRSNVRRWYALVTGSRDRLLAEHAACGQRFLDGAQLLKEVAG